MLRYYKTNPARLRPTDRMIAHTGYLVFARKIEPSDDPRGAALAKEIMALRRSANMFRRARNS